MNDIAVANVERALLHAGVHGQALAGMMAMVRNIVGTRGKVARTTCRCGDEPDGLTRDELPKLSTIARRFLRDSLRRSEAVGTVIEDASWNMMLAIYADAAEGGETPTSSACYASGVPPTTALRHIDRLAKDGLVVRHEDPFDRRRTLLRPTAASIERMEGMIQAFCIARPTPSV